MTTNNDKKILKEGVINFFSKKREFRSLSNFWEMDVEIIDEGKEGKEKRAYESGEHCFHGEKYIRLGNLCVDEGRKMELLEYGVRFFKPSLYKTGAEVKKMGGKKGLCLSRVEMGLWNSISLEVQMEICRFKLENYEEVRGDLLRSEGKILIHPALRCSEEKLEREKIWEGKGVVRDGKIVVVGRNLLGNIWMDLRG